MAIVIGILIGLVAGGALAVAWPRLHRRLPARRGAPDPAAADPGGAARGRGAPARGAARGEGGGRPAARGGRAGAQGAAGRGAARRRSGWPRARASSSGALTELERREQGIADREEHARQLQEELKAAKEQELAELERVSGMTVNEAKAEVLDALRGARPPRARPAGAADGGGGAVGGAAPRPQPRRRRAPARRRQPRRRDDGLARRASLRRHEGPDHRPGGPQHPHARAPDRRRHHHRRHARARSSSRRSTGSGARSRRSR